MELLIYFVPVFAGIIGSKYLARLANFALVVAVFQFDLVLLMGQFGHFSVLALSPYTVLFIIPALMGTVGNRYLGRSRLIVGIGSRFFHLGKIANALLVIAVFWLGGVLLVYRSRGQFMPLSFLAAASVSAGFVAPPLVFILVAIVTYRLRQRWHITEEVRTYSIRDHVNHGGH